MKRKQKSLRQLARELGVSHSYLSQVKHGKRPASDKVVSILSNSEARFVTSNPSRGISNVSGGFDSHTLPPLLKYVLKASVRRTENNHRGNTKLSYRSYWRI